MARTRYNILLLTDELVVKHSWFMHIMLAIDQLGNALAWGNHDNTVSSRIGYNMSISKGGSWYWGMLELIVNGCFYLVDGANHCDEAYRGDYTEEFLKTNWLAKIILVVIVLLACIPLYLIVYFVAIFPCFRNKFYHQGEKIIIVKVNELRKR